MAFAILEVLMPDGTQLTFGPYPEPPDETERTRLREEIARTNQPEALLTRDGRPAVRLDKPPVHWRFERVTRFTLKQSARPSHDRAPCAFCSSNHPKYLTGSLLWCEDAFLRPIGHMCADDFFAGKQGGWAAIEREANLRDSAAEACSKLLYARRPAVTHECSHGHGECDSLSFVLGEGAAMVA
ncbi:hypothetical protein, partial [Falsiroseomonas selenitidurans]|uniref:hypothetical protein n=1 Tax=Falsiroseomonas selenitidurans TaxID=2716335 RepID=UPI001ADE2B1C